MFVWKCSPQWICSWQEWFFLVSMTITWSDLISLWTFNIHLGRIDVFETWVGLHEQSPCITVSLMLICPSPYFICRRNIVSLDGITICGASYLLLSSEFSQSHLFHPLKALSPIPPNCHCHCLYQRNLKKVHSCKTNRLNNILFILMDLGQHKIIYQGCWLDK